MFRYLHKVLYILSSKKIDLIFLLCAFLVVSVLEAFGIGLIGPFISLASHPKIIQQNYWLKEAYNLSTLESEAQFIAVIGFLIVAIFCIKSFSSWLVQSNVFKFSYMQQGKLIEKLMHAYLFAPYTFHLSKNSSFIIQNITQETARYSNCVLIPLLVSTSNTIVLLCLSVLLCITNLATLLVILGVSLPLFFMFNHFKDKIRGWGREASQANEEIVRLINHGLGGIKETQVIGCGSYFEEQIAKQTQRYVDASGAFFAFKLSPRVIIEALLVIFLVSFVSIFLLLGQDIQQLTSVLSIFALAAIRLIPAASNLADGVSTLRNSSYTVNKLYSDLKELETVRNDKVSELLLDADGDKQLDYKNKYHQKINFSKQIVLDAVTYCYPNAPEPSLNGLSITILKGQSIALIGKSGAGKTTLVDVILGLLIPGSGDIQVDGKSIYHNLRSWQDLIGYIPQSIFLIDDTIAKNIAFGIPDHLIDYQRLNKAIQSAQLVDLIEGLPNGVQTMVGERGVLLSGGQRQRIGIARALYHEREILVLDEATAALDNETESLVTEAMKSLSGKKTMIIIAHRLSTVEHCDRIYMMEKGRIIKSGSYKEVVLTGENDSLTEA